MAAIASMNSLQGTLAPGKPIAIVRSTRPHSNSIHGFSRIAVTGRKNFKIQAVLTAESTLDVTKMAPLGDRLLVKPKEQEETTAGGILLAGSSTRRMEDAHVGTVVAIGDEVDLGVVVGDMVLFTKYGSSDLEVPNGEVCFVAQKSILAKLS